MKNDGVNTIEDIEERKDYIEKVWATFPDLCRTITEVETKENYIPDKSVVANMIKSEEYVMKAINFKLGY
jgi:enamine deaminase RidA (YjgF/YER057c/UK114 family)